MSTQPMSKQWAIFDRAVDVFVWIAAGLLVFSFLSTCADVIFRYLLSKPIAWSPEVTEYILLQITFLGGAWLLRKEGHVNVDIVLTRLSPKNQAILGFATSIICILICLTLTWFGVVTTISLYRDHTIIPKQLDMPKYLMFIVIPLGYFMLAGQFFRRSSKLWSTWKSLGTGKSAVK